MKNEFNGFYGLQEDEVKHMWENAHFVLDANVLLNLYRYQESTTEQLIGVIERLKDRIWVPYHVALEYQRNRLKVIAGQNSKFSEVKKVVNQCTSSVRGELSKLQLDKRHSTIAPDGFVSDIEAAGKKFLEELDKLEKEHFSVIGEDKIRVKLDTLLDGKIGPRPSEQDEIDTLEKEAEKRFKKRTPPGYMDDNKDKSGEPIFSYSDLSYQRKYSDYIVWSQIMDYAKEKKLSDLIFITDDNKEDWWLKVRQQGEKTISPRPELISEISKKTEVERFHMYSSEGFLKQANEQLKIGVSEETIEDVRDVAHTQSKNSVSELNDCKLNSEDKNKLINWVQRTYSTYLPLMVPDSNIDIIMFSEKRSIAFCFYTVNYPIDIVVSIVDSILEAHEQAEHSGIDEIVVILSFRDSKLIEAVSKMFEMNAIGLPATTIILGRFVTNNNAGMLSGMTEFKQIGSTIRIE